MPLSWDIPSEHAKKRILLHCDNENVCDWIDGINKCTDIGHYIVKDTIKTLHNIWLTEKATFYHDHFRWMAHVYRENNAEADDLAALGCNQGPTQWTSGLIGTSEWRCLRAFSDGSSHMTTPGVFTGGFGWCISGVSNATASGS